MDPNIIARLNTQYFVPDNLGDVNNATSIQILQRVDQAVPENLKAIRSVDFKFDFATLTTDQDRQMDSTYSELHVEPLLNQAADLFDRCLRDRTEYDELFVRAFNLGIDIKQFVETDKVHREETIAGYYDVVSTQSATEVAAEEAIAKNYRAVVDELTQIINGYLSSDRIEQRCALAEKGAQATGLPSLGFKSEFPGDAGNYVTSPNNNHFLSYGFNNEPANIPFKLSGSVARTEMKSQLEQEKSQFQAQINEYSRLAAISEKKVVALKAKQAFDILDGGSPDGPQASQPNTNFRFRRMEVARRLNEWKTIAATDPTSALNYSERMKQIRTRIERDWRAGYARITAAQKGLKNLYGYEPDLPPDGTPNAIDRCLIWTRNAIDAMMVLAQSEQNYVLPISIKNIIDRETSTSMGTFRGAMDTHAIDPITQLEKPIVLSFIIPDNLFPDQFHVRLRGMSVFVIEITPGIAWQVTIKPPRQSLCRFRQDPIGTTPHSMRQGIRPVRHCRVQTREAVRDPDIIGISSLYNISPISDLNADAELARWSLTIDRFSLNNTNASSLVDIHIDLHIAMQTR